MEAFLTGGAPYDLGLHRIPKAPFFVRPHENDMPAFLKKLQDPKTLFTCGRKATRWRKKSSVFKNIPIRVKGALCSLRKKIPSPQWKNNRILFLKS